MSRDLVGRGGLFPSSLDRATDRALDRIESRSLIARSADRAAIQRQVATTQFGMEGAAYLAAHEEALCQGIPGARSEIRAIRHAGTVGILGIVSRAGMDF